MRVERGDDVMLLPLRCGELLLECRVATAAMVCDDVGEMRAELAFPGMRRKGRSCFALGLLFL